MKHLRKSMRKLTRFEKCVTGLLVVCFFGSQLLSLGVHSMKLSIDKRISEVEEQIQKLEQNNKATEVKINEKTTYEQIAQTATQDGMKQYAQNIRKLMK